MLKILNSFERALRIKTALQIKLNKLKIKNKLNCDGKNIIKGPLLVRKGDSTGIINREALWSKNYRTQITNRTVKEIDRKKWQKLEDIPNWGYRFVKL